jgi:opacity protein-like surface antigen
MKIFTLEAILLLATTVCFAQTKWNVEFYSGTGLFNETSALNGPETTYDSVSVPLGISGGYYFTDFVGLKAYLDFLIPVSFIAHPDSGTTITKENYDFLLGMDEFFGIVFNVAKTERFTIPVTVGLHGKLFFSTIANHFTMASNSGIGAGIGVEYNITDKLYILARVNGSFDFIGLSIMFPTGNADNDRETKVDAAFMHTWGIAPHIGIGIKF